MAIPLTVSVLALIAGAVVLFRWLRTSRSQTAAAPLPPGPRRLPLVGNLHNAPTTNGFLDFHAWSKTYGPIMSLSVLGQTVVILDDAQTANDLLSKRAATYSGRPFNVTSTMVTGPQGHGRDGPDRAGRPLHVLLSPYDAEFRLHQRLLSACMNVTSQDRFRALQALESAQLLRDLLAEPHRDAGVASARVYAHLERGQASLTLGLSYGYRVHHPDDPVTQETLHVHNTLTHLVTGTQLVDVLPFLKRLPTSVSPWWRAADACFALESDLHRRNFAAGLANPGWNFSKKLRASDGGAGLSDFLLGYVVGANTIAGTETTPRALMWFFVAALTCRSSSGGDDFVARARAVLDAAVGRTRMPSFEDRAALAYVEAVVLEMLRWRPIAPSGVPHRADADDEYRGWRIPEGAVVIANAWGIGRDASVFGDRVDDFVPERWLRVDGETTTVRRDLPHPFFGYGKRMCTGRYLALDGLWILVARLLWAFDFAPAGEEGSMPDPLDLRPHGFTITPGPFKLRLEPRGAWVEDVVRREWDGAAKDLASVLGEMPKAE